MAGLVPAIHALLVRPKTWMPGTRPGMTASERRWIDERAPPRRRRTAAEGIFLHGGQSRLGAAAARQISGGSSGLRRDPDLVARAGAGGRLDAAEGDRIRRGLSRHGLYPRARGRD